MRLNTYFAACSWSDVQNRKAWSNFWCPLKTSSEKEEGLESFPFVWPGVLQTGILLTQMLSKMRKLQLSPVISAIYQPPLPEQHAEPELSHCPSAAPCTMFSFSQVNHLPRRERLLDSWPERLRSDITYNVLWSTIWQFLISFTHYFMTNNFCYP